MNQIKQKIAEIGLSQREISVRLGKNPSYLAGVLRSGLSTAKQAELLNDLEVVANGWTIMSDDEIIAELSQKLSDAQDGNRQLRDESDKYFNELSKTKCNLEAMGRFFDQCKEERWKYKDKYEYHLRLNLFLICMILIGLILIGLISWVLK